MMQSNLLWTAMCLLWVACGLTLLYTPPSPIEYLAGDSVTPKQVRVGDTFSIHRNFRVVRKGSIYITRTMIQGNCKVDCEIIDLPNGNAILEPGIYMGRIREYVMPISANPGTWRLVFAYTYEDQLGRKVRRNIPELTIEVMK